MSKYPNIQRECELGNYEYVKTLRNLTYDRIAKERYYKEKFTGVKQPVITEDDVNTEVDKFLSTLPEIFTRDFQIINSK